MEETQLGGLTSEGRAVVAPKSLGPVPFLDRLFLGHHVHATQLPHCVPRSFYCSFSLLAAHLSPSHRPIPSYGPLSSSHPISFNQTPVSPHTDGSTPPPHSSAQLLGTLVPFSTLHSNPFTLGSPCGTMRREGLLRTRRTCPPNPQTPLLLCSGA